MIKHNAYYELFASMTVPNHEEVGYWVDLAANSKGKIIKVFNKDINKWVILVDESRQDYVPPFIGSNGNWWIDNRDTGVKATAASPRIGENGNWFTYDPISKKYIDTGVVAEGLNAYQIAVRNGFVGSENDWVKSLSKASEDAAVIALEAADKANKATEKALEVTTIVSELVDDAEAAIDKAEELAQNPPKIVNNEWWVYQYETKEYINTGISAIGDAFTYKKEYASIADMEADFATTDVEIGEYVLINTGDVENEDDAKVYLKTLQGWKFIVDLSGMQGIQGWSAYEVAVRNGFVGTEEEWLQSLKQPALDAAAQVQDAIDSVKETEASVKEAEANRVIAEQGRVDAENTRVSNEDQRIADEDARKLAEESRVSTETERDTAEQERIANELIRQQNETVRETQEANRESNTAAAIDAVNEAKNNAELATANANTQADRAKDYADNPPKVGDDGYWYVWDETADSYVKTGWPSTGLNLKGAFSTLDELKANVTDPEVGDAYMVGGDLYVWNGSDWTNAGRIQGPQGEPGKDAEITRAAIENVLTGEVTTHTHDNRYYTEDEIDQKFTDANEALVQNYYNKLQIDSKLTAVYTFKGSKPTRDELPTEGNVVGDVWNIESTDENVAWTENGWDALGGTAELASATNNGLMSIDNFNKLTGIDANAQVNKIEVINKRGDLAITNKRVIIPEDIAITPDEPVNDEIIWLDTDEDYNFEVIGYNKEESDARYVQKEAGKGLSANDYTTLEKNKLANLKNYDDADIKASITTLETNKADKTELPTKVSQLENDANYINDVSNKVDKVDGKSLIDDTEIARLAGVDNYTLPTASADIKGGIKVGAGLTITDDVLSADVQEVDLSDYSTTEENDAKYVPLTGGSLEKIGFGSEDNSTLFISGSAPMIKIYDNNEGSRNSLNLFQTTSEGTISFVDENASRTYNRIIFDSNGNIKLSGNLICLDRYNLNEYKIWHRGNDGVDSGLDADLLDGKQGSDYVLTTDTRLSDARTPLAHQHSKGDITDFSHTHTKADITDFPTSMPASDVPDWAKAASKPSYTADEVGALSNTISIPSKTSDLTNDSEFVAETVYENVVINSWVSDTTYADYPFRGTTTVAGVTEEDFAEVVFNVAEATSGEYAPVCSTSAGIITIYSAKQDTITIPTIIIKKYA